MTHYKKHKLYKRKDGRWQIKFIYNKKIYFAYGRSQKECCNNFDKLLKKAKNSTLNSKTLLFDWLDEYVNIYKKNNKTVNETIRQINYHIKPNLQNVELSKIQTLELDKLISEIPTTRTQKAIFTILHNALSIAYKKRLINDNIADFITPVHHISKEGKRLNSEEIKEIFKNIENECVYNLFYFYLYTGVRKSEALTLKFDDIDFENQVIHIKGTKTIKSDRYIPLFENIKKIITQDNMGSESLIFNISNSTIEREIKKIKLKTNIKFSIKDFRTTFASACHEKGIDDYSIKQWLGHTSVTTTQKHYIKYDNAKSFIDAEQTKDLFKI